MGGAAGTEVGWLAKREGSKCIEGGGRESICKMDEREWMEVLNTRWFCLCFVCVVDWWVSAGIEEEEKV